MSINYCLRIERKTGTLVSVNFIFRWYKYCLGNGKDFAHSLDEHAAKGENFVVSDSGVSHAKMIAELIQKSFLLSGID